MILRCRNFCAISQLFFMCGVRYLRSFIFVGVMCVVDFCGLSCWYLCCVNSFILYLVSVRYFSNVVNAVGILLIKFAMVYRKCSRLLVYVCFQVLVCGCVRWCAVWRFLSVCRSERLCCM